MIKKILAVAHQIGGANTLSPVIKKLENIENLNISVIGYDFSAEGFSDYKIKYNLPESYDFYNKKDPLKSAEKILEFEQPDLLLCGSSNGFNLEKAMVVQCNRKAIPSIGVLDNWTNLELRFSENKDSTDFVYLPDKLAIMDKHTENELIKLGIAGEKLVITGQPYLDDIKHYGDNVNSRSVKKNLGINENDFVITFVSEPHSKDYGVDSSSPLFKGFTEFDVLKCIIATINDITLNIDKNIYLIIKLHPREDRYELQSLLRNTAFDYKLIKKYNQRKLIIASDVVVGIESMMMIEAALLNKLTFSLQPGLIGKDKLFCNKMGITIPAYSCNEFSNKFNKIISNGFSNNLSLNNLNLDGLAYDRVISKIKELL